jgi:hypothetical protein
MVMFFLGFADFGDPEPAHCSVRPIAIRFQVLRVEHGLGRPLRLSGGALSRIGPI